MYFSNCTRPDMAYAIGMLSKYTNNPNIEHWNALEMVFRYLKGIINYGIQYFGFPLVLEGLNDGNWILDSDETKTTSVYVFTLGGCVVAWKSAKQIIISQSTMKLEFIALDLTCTNGEWLKILLTDMPLFNKPIPLVSIHCDNQASRAKAKGANLNEKMRHKNST